MTDTANLPSSLKRDGLFCCWRYEKNPDNPDKPKKVPYSPIGGHRASSTNEKDFASFAGAEAVQSKYDGLGVGIFGDLAAIDIDHCIDKGGSYNQLARDIVFWFEARIPPAYIETSPSGTGIRILFRAPGFQYDKQKYYINNQKIGLEVYVAGATNKYVTVTGNAQVKCDELPDCTEELEMILEHHMRRDSNSQASAAVPPSTSVIPGDTELLEKISVSKQGQQFDRLWTGDTSGHGGDDSAADLALCNMLAFWTGKDAIRMDTLFRQSGLMREKWDKMHGAMTYGAMTIEKAIVDCRDAYTGEVPKATAAEDFAHPALSIQVPTLVKASDIPYADPRWLIKPYFQRGKGTMIQADGGTGKTALMCAFAAHVSTGRPFLDIQVESPGDVLILSVEDDLPILRGRIEANSGDLDKCHFITNAAGLTFNSPQVEQAVKEVNAKLLIFDPFQAFIGAKVNMDKSNQTRPELAMLFEMADRNDCAVAIIAHTGKDAIGKSAVNRSLGSVDIGAAMRSIIHVVENPENPDERVGIHVKCSNAIKGRSFSYEIGDRGRVIWKGYSNMTADDLSFMTKRKNKGISYEQEPIVIGVRAFIAQNPKGGKLTYDEFSTLCITECGIAPYANNREAAEKIPTLKAEIMKQDNIMVETGLRVKHGKGVSVTPYLAPTDFQMDWIKEATDADS